MGNYCLLISRLSVCLRAQGWERGEEDQSGDQGT
jgi:hypothetical protein